MPADLHASLTPKTALLELRGLDVAFPGHHAVRDLDLSLHAGQTLALVGESGCGKSTTALSILRLLPASARVGGRILFEGHDILGLDETALSTLRGNRIGMIFQEPMTSLNPVLTIGQQVAEPLRLHRGLSAQAARKRAIELLDLVKFPDPRRRVDDHPHRLSGGQRQRVMIAAAIACHPALLIADEPTTALDVTIQAQILTLLDDLRRELDMALLLITHDLSVVSDWADQVAVMYAGRTVERAHGGTFFAHPRHAYSQGLLGASLRLGDELHYTSRRLTEIRATSEPGSDHVAFALTSPESAVPAAPLVRPYPAPLLSVANLHTVYETAAGPYHAVRGVSFEIAAGETLGLVGESGCGKSTLSKTLVRLVEPRHGRIVLDGTDITGLSRRALTPHRAKMQMVFQDPYASLNPRQSLNDILEFALTVHGDASRSSRRARIRAIVEAVGLPAASLSRYPHQFSGGQRQRISIARALVLRPSLLICDEPVSALDVSVQAQILNLLVDLKHEFGLALLFISHDLSVVHYIADRVMVMHGGEIVEQGDRRTIWKQPQHAYTRSLIQAVPGGRRATPGPLPPSSASLHESPTRASAQHLPDDHAHPQLGRHVASSR
jgi:peptide/nickel transport system ATP-binding protein